LEQERSRKAAQADLVIEIARVLGDADRRQLFSQSLISDPPPLKLSLKEILGASLVFHIHGIGLGDQTRWQNTVDSSYSLFRF